MSIRSLLAISVIALATLFFGVAVILAGLVGQGGRVGGMLGRVWAQWVLRAVGVRVEVSGAVNVPSGPALYAANHGSALDIPILFAHLPVDFRIIHKRSLYLVPVLGWSLWFAGHIGIDRRHPFRAKRSLEAAARRIRDGASLAAFPEGTRSPDAAVRPFKRGSFVLATQAGVPVVPVSLNGVKRLAPSGLPSLRPGTVHMKIHPPVETAGRSSDAAGALAEEVRRIVAAGCEEG